MLQHHRVPQQFRILGIEVLHDLLYIVIAVHCGVVLLFGLEFALLGQHLLAYGEYRNSTLVGEFFCAGVCTVSVFAKADGFVSCMRIRLLLLIFR
jgi:uncharacterized membrane protein YciS (DUF1049 family)